MFGRLNEEKVILWASIVLIVGLLIIVPQLRLIQGHPPAVTAETYELLNQADAPSDLVTLLIRLVLDSAHASVLLTIIPILFAILSLLLIFAHVAYEQDLPNLAFLTGMAVALTPAFLAAHLSLTMMSAVLLLVLTTTYLYRRQLIAYLVVLGMLFAIDPLSGTLLGAALLWYTWRTTSRRESMALLFALLALLTIHFVMPLRVPFASAFATDGLFLFFGSVTGFSLAIVTLASAGIVLEFYQHKQSLLTWLAIIAIVIGALYQPLRLVAIVIAVGYAARAFLAILTHRYKNPELGRYIILLFLLMFLFAAMTFIRGTLVASPTASEVHAYGQIAETPPGNVLVHKESAVYAEYFTGREIIVENIYAWRDLERFTTFLEENGIRYILIDEHVRNQLHRDEEGILFLLNNNDAFQPFYKYKEEIFIFS